LLIGDSGLLMVVFDISCECVRMECEGGRGDRGKRGNQSERERKRENGSEERRGQSERE